LVAAFVLISGTWPAANPASAEARARCSSEGSKTVMRTSQVRVFRKRGRTFACRYRTDRNFRLGDLPAFPDGYLIEHLQVLGHSVGYELAFRGRGDPDSQVRTIDLATGMRRFLGSDAEQIDPPEAGSALEVGVTDLELGPSGSVAWINRNVYVRPARYEVLKSDGEGSKVLLDSGEGIDPASLSRVGSTISWVKEGQPKAAVLR